MLGLAPLNALRAFEAAARRGSFAAAALELNVTPAAVGQHVRQLEALVGAPLFNRVGRQLELTERGAEALPSLQKGFELVGEASAALREPRAAGMITLAASAEILALWVATDIARWPGADDLVLHSIAADQTTRHALEAGADIVIGKAFDTPAGSDHLTSEIITPLVSPKRQLKGEGLDRLLSAPLIEDQSLELTWSQWASARGAFGEGYKARLKAPDTRTAFALAGAGAGILLARKVLALDAIRSGDLAPVLPDGDHRVDAAYFLQVAPASVTRPSVLALADHIKRSFAARLDMAGEL
jgi:LysR family glycine cleavage system transcriptional activator